MLPSTFVMHITTLRVGILSIRSAATARGNLAVLKPISMNSNEAKEAVDC